jgi:hypothetical protein
VVTLQGNGLFGNGKWDLKYEDSEFPFRAPGNWRGTTDPTALRIEGPVQPLPILQAPPDTRADQG